MFQDLSSLSELELVSLIHRANEELSVRKEKEKEAIRSEIEERLRRTGLSFADIFPQFASEAPKKGVIEGSTRQVTPKYRHPVSRDTWSGRGAHPPQWVKNVLAERDWTMQDFKSSEEFLA